MSAIDQINQGGTTYEIVPEIAELFSIEKTYRAGDHVIYEAGWYTFKTDKYAGAWDATKVDGPFKVTNELSSLKSEFTDTFNAYEIYNRGVIKASLTSEGANKGYLNQNDNCRTVWIKCKPDTPYTVQKNAGGRFAIGCTNASAPPQIADRCIPDSVVANATGTEITITTPSDATYLCAFVYFATTDGADADAMLASVRINELSAFDRIARYDTETYDTINLNYIHASSAIIRTYIPYRFIKGKAYKLRFTVDRDYYLGSGSVTLSMRSNASLKETAIVDVIVDDIHNALKAGTYEYSFIASADAIALYVYQKDVGTSFKCDIEIYDGTKAPDKIAELQKYIGVGNGYEYNSVAKLSLKKYTLDCTFYGTITKPSNTTTPQGCAIYGDTLIQLFDGGTFAIYDMAAPATIVSSGNLGSVASTNHCNNCSIGKKYDNNDELPLIYVTAGMVGHDVYCAVERFAVSNGSYSASVVQNITIDYDSFSASGFKNIYPVPNFFVDDKYLYLFGALQRTNGSTDPKTNRFVITKFALPDPTSGDVELTGADIYDQFVMPYTTEIMQGGTIYNGLIYHLFGYGGTSNEMRVFDTTTGAEVAHIDALQLPYASEEPESCAVYDEKMYVMTASGKLYAIEF